VRPNRTGATQRGTARAAFVGLLLFVLLLYTNLGHLVPEVGHVPWVKGAAGLSLAALGVSALLYRRRLWSGGALGALLVALFAWMGASATWSLWPSLTVDAFLDGLKYLAIFLLVANVVDERRSVVLMHALAWASVIPAAGAISSWSRGEHLVEGDRAAWIGIFANPNELAHWLVVGVALALAGREAARSTWLRLAYLPAILTLATAILLTQSRGGMFAFGAVVALATLRGAARGHIAVGAAAALLLAVELAPGGAWRRAGTALDYREDASARGRIDAWRTGWNVAAERPFTGVGAGAFLLAWRSFAPGDAGPARAPHSTVIQLLGETGLPSLLLLGTAVGVAAAHLSRATRRGSTVARGVQGGLAAWAVCSLTGSLAWSWPLYLLLGLAAASSRTPRPA
jgi:O-antigen ligase